MIWRLWLVLVALLACGVLEAEQRFVITTAPNVPVASGAIWAYSWSWYGLGHVKLADIRNGVAVLPDDLDRVRRELDPHVNTDAYFLVVQTGESTYYRGRDVQGDARGEAFWQNLGKGIKALGAVTADGPQETRLVLPAPAGRKLTFVLPDGKPAVGIAVTAETYMWDHNHCAAHMGGFPLGSFKTDASGSIVVMTTPSPLYLTVDYDTEAGPGPVGMTYTMNRSLKLEPGGDEVLKGIWMSDESSGPDRNREYTIRVVDSGGAPLKGILVGFMWNTNSCGGGERVRQTDAQGLFEFPFDARYLSAIVLIKEVTGASEVQQDLTDEEIRRMFRTGRVTVVWNPRKEE